MELVAPTLKDQKTQEQDLREAFKVFDKNGNIFKYPHSLLAIIYHGFFFHIYNECQLN